MKFDEFVVEQVERLGAIPEFVAKVTEGGRKEIVKWLTKEADEPTPARQRLGASERIHESPAAGRVKSVIDECVEFTAPPGLSDIKAVWRRLNPPLNEQREKCSRCGGTGWIVVQGEYGTSAAYPCTHKPKTEAEDRLGVKFAPAVAAQYSREIIESRERNEAWRASKEFPLTKVRQPETKDKHTGTNQAHNSSGFRGNRMSTPRYRRTDPHFHGWLLASCSGCSQ